MKINWKSVKIDGYPPAPGRYLVSVEDLPPDGRITTIAEYYGGRGWGFIGETYFIKAWAELPEPYLGE